MAVFVGVVVAVAVGEEVIVAEGLGVSVIVDVTVGVIVGVTTVSPRHAASMSVSNNKKKVPLRILGRDIGPPIKGLLCKDTESDC